jgi:hypothetical protein
LGQLATVIWLIKEGGASLTEVDDDGNTALLCALPHNLLVATWLLEHGGADMADVNNDGQTVWDFMTEEGCDDTSVAALLRVMVILGAPSAEFIAGWAEVSEEYARVLEDGARLRAWLPAYIARRRVFLCALPAYLGDPQAQLGGQVLLLPTVLWALISSFDALTTEKTWTMGLGADQ